MDRRQHSRLPRHVAGCAERPGCVFSVRQAILHSSEPDVWVVAADSRTVMAIAAINSTNSHTSDDVVNIPNAIESGSPCRSSAVRGVARVATMTLVAMTTASLAGCAGA